MKSENGAYNSFNVQRNAFPRKRSLNIVLLQTDAGGFARRDRTTVHREVCVCVFFWGVDFLIVCCVFCCCIRG